MEKNQSSIIAHVALPVRLGHIQWMWKSNNNSLFSSQLEDWCCYSAIDTAIIEEAYMNKLSEAVLDDYHISFKYLVQISNNNYKDQRPVRRTINERKVVGLREERFLSNPLSPSKPFDHGLVPFKRLVREYFNLPSSGWDVLKHEAVRRMMVVHAAAGLVVEGKMLGQQKKGEWLSQQLLNVKEGTMRELWECCVRLYCMESFLYREMNKYIRLVVDKEYEDVWKSKVPTYGPFVLILTDHVWDSCGETMMVYRGTDLPDKLIEQFRRRVGRGKTFWAYRFPAFTSTTRNRNVAEFFAGNTLFDIKIHSGDGDDVSRYSEFGEEEHLLRAGFDFYIRSCTFADDKKKWIIHLESYRTVSKKSHSRRSITTVVNRDRNESEKP